MTFALCAVVPTYNHAKVLPEIVAALRAFDLSIFIVDDGSGAPLARGHSPIAQTRRKCRSHPAARKLGQGRSRRVGLRRALAAGFTHAIQVDGDGQHDLSALTDLIELAKAHPDALVSGRPIYDGSIPRGRLIGRWFTHFWIWIETLSTRIADSMCGFRIYPLRATVSVLDDSAVGQRMDFDPEIMVRLFWRGTPTLHVPVRVVYPEGNTSNFRMLHDNWLITRMHTRLVLGMVARLPSILRLRPSFPESSAHWSNFAEHGARLGLRSIQIVHRVFGRRGALALAAAVTGYFFLIDGRRREFSLSYLRRVHAMQGAAPPDWRDAYLHFYSFAAKALDTMIAWTSPESVGPFTIVGAEPLDRLDREGRGALLIVSHHGNAELSRACLQHRFKRPIHSLVHTRHARHYNAIIRSIRPDAVDSAIEVDDIGPGLAIALRERVERGEWIAIAGDRTPFSGMSRTVPAPFLAIPHLSQPAPIFSRRC